MRYKFLILLLIVLGFFGFYGSYLVSKERETLVKKAVDSNQILKTVDRRLDSETDFNKKYINELKIILIQQQKALDNHDAILKKGSEIIASQERIIKQLDQIQDSLSKH